MAAPETGGWRLPDARQKLDEIIDAALKSAPQRITRNHDQAVVVISKRHYDALVEAAAKHEKKQGISAETREYLLTAGRGPQDDPLDEYTDD